MLKTFTILMFVFFTGEIYSQKESNTWYFGYNAGLNFNTAPPTILTNGQINTREGVCSISDKTTGQILFYSEGTTVWDKNNSPMPNGTGLMGDYSSTQSCIAVPNPGNSNKYYLFTTAVFNGMRYSEIDMTLNGGNGDIIAATKNTLLIADNESCEKLIAVSHCNKKDFWIVSHKLSSNAFMVYLVSSSGIQAPIIQNIGTVLGDASNWSGTGYLKFSADGSRLANAIGPDPIGALSNVELMNFNNRTGIISGPVVQLTGLDFPYGIEFSPTNNFLYVTELIGKKIVQYNLNAPDINTSKFVIHSSADLGYGALQMAPDGKIYVAAENGYTIGYVYLGRIDLPDIADAGCNYIQDAINLGQGTALLGLPTFSANFLYRDTASISYTSTCAGTAGTFSISNTNNIDSVRWDFGDASAFSTLISPVHAYTSANIYNVQLILYRSCNKNDTITKPVTINNCSNSICLDCTTASPINSGLVVCMPFNGDASDLAGMNNNGTVIGATLTSDRFGNANSAYSFNGTSDYINGTVTPDLLTNEYTYSAWVKFNALPPVASHLSFISIGGDVMDQTIAYRNLPGITGFTAGSYDDQGGPSGAQSTIVPVIGDWYHIASTRDNNSIKLYINGILTASSTTGANAGYNPVSTFHIGARSDTYTYISDYGINGIIDDIRIYNRVLDANEINQIYSSTNCNNIINTYTPVLAFEPCTNKITVEDAITFNAGDTVLLIQMKGAVIDSSNSSSFGTITDYKNAGNYEFNYVKSKTGNIIELKNKLTRQYDIPNGKVQLVRVPYYQSLNVNSTLSCLPWDGNKGGVLVLNVQDTITLNADIDVSGKGFHGGVSVPNQDCPDCENTPGYFYPISADVTGEKGEGIFFNSNPNFAGGRGAIANGGGSGSCKNGGGGGGSNLGFGGIGGLSFNGCSGSSSLASGLGGYALNNVTSQNKIFLGGGGGAGEADNTPPVATNGTNGGGVIIIRSGVLIGNGQSIKSNGMDQNLIAQWDGGGGGGAGGSILLDINIYSGITNIYSTGGKGSDNNSNNFPDYCHAPGGGGGGGLVWFKQGIMPTGVTVSTSGGVAGNILNSASACAGTTYGAGNGTNGNGLFNLSMPVANIPFVPGVISSFLTITICQGQDHAGYITSGTYVDTLISIYGCDSIRTLVLTVNPKSYSTITQTICSGQTYSGYSASGNYIDTLVAINGCDSVRTINLTVKPRPYLTVIQSICQGQTYLGHNTSGTYIDTLVAANGCDSIRTLQLTILPKPIPDLGIDKEICSGDSLILYPGSFSTYNWQNGSAQSHFVTKQPGLYSVLVTNNCGSATDQILVKEKICDIYFPSAFTPNNDGKNDQFKILGANAISDYHLTVYNRWGQKVFETTDYTKGWDGIVNGKLQNTGVFVWYSGFRKKDNPNKILMKGTVVLIK